MKFLNSFILLLLVITNIVGAYYLYLVVDNPIDRDINRLFLVYKEKNLTNKLEDNITNYATTYKTMSENEIIHEAKKICKYYQDIDYRIDKVTLSSRFVLKYKSELKANTRETLEICQNINADFYVRLDAPIAQLKKTVTEMHDLLGRKYKLQNTTVDKYPILSVLTFILFGLLFYLMISKQKKWVSYSLKVSITLFFTLLILGVNLNPLYTLAFLIIIIYIGFLTIIYNRQVKLLPNQ